MDDIQCKIVASYVIVWFIKPHYDILMWGPHNHFLTLKFNLAWIKQNLHHLFHFVNWGNMKVFAIGTVEL